MFDNLVKECKRNFDAWEIVNFKTISDSVGFEAGKLKDIDASERSGYALRAVKDGKMAYGITYKPDGHRELVEAVLGNIPYGSAFEIEFSGRSPYTSPKIRSKATKEMNIEGMIEMGRQLVEPLKSVDKDAKIGAGVTKTNQKVRIRTSSHFEGEYEKDGCSYGAYVQLTKDDNMLAVGDGFNGVRPDQPISKMTEKVKTQFEWGKKNVPAKTGKYKVLFSADAFAHAISILISSFSGRNVFRGVSPFIGQYGKTIFDKRITLTDDGLMDFAPESAPFDHEGTPMQTTKLVKDGKLCGYLLDLEAAKKLNMKPNGKAFKRSGFYGGADLDPIPAVGPSTIRLEPGKRHTDEILEEVSEGIYIDSLLGTMMSNPLTGMLSGNIDLGFLIKKGEIAGRIKDAMLSVNLFEVLKSGLIEISGEMTRTAGWGGKVELPSVFLDNCTIAVKS